MAVTLREEIVNPDSGPLAEGEAESQQEKNGRKFEFPSQPLGGDAQGEDHGEVDKR